MDEKHRKRYWIWIVYALLGIALIVGIQLSQTKPTTSIDYSDFLDRLDKGEIRSVTISQSTVTGTYIENGASTNFKTTIVPNTQITNLIADLRAHGVVFKGEVTSTLWRDVLLTWLLPIAIIVLLWFFLFRRLSSRMGGAGGALSFGQSKAKIYDRSKDRVTFDDVAGLDEPKTELLEIIDFLKNPQKYRKLGARIPKGVLLVGAPGTGKTLLARAVAGEADVPFFAISGSQFVEMFVGVGAARVRDLFEQAKEKAPCIIFIDELDALGKARGLGGMTGGHDEREQTLNQLLVEMDGFDSKVGVILMAATNRPEILDPALLRPGRFDRHILVDRPDKKGREDILKVHLRTVKTEPDVDIEKLAAMTPGMVGADLANLANEAALLAVRRNKKLVGMSEFQEAVERIIGGLEKKNRVINPHERDVVAHHEMGHAIVAMSLPGTDPVQKISIIPRGIAALGYTMQVPTEDRFLMSKTELQNKIASLLGGRAAEEIIFSDISTGAHNDLSRATDIAKSMVKEYGMSDSLGQVYLAHDRRSQFMDFGMENRGDYSEATAQAIDREIQQIIFSQYKVAMDILKARRDTLVKGAGLLLDKEKIDHDEIKALMETT